MKPHRNLTCQLLHRDAPAHYHGGKLWSCARCGSSWAESASRTMRAGHAVGRALGGRAALALLLVTTAAVLVAVPLARLIAG